ncbi:MAG: hypothetical protein WD709_00840 [Gammaproteobacteria bacterium]
MSLKHPIHDEADWQYDWEDHALEQLRAWQETTHTQRLAWLEEAILLAHKSGALHKRQNDTEIN